MRRRRRRRLAIAGSVLALLGVPSSAGAHAALETASPASGVTLKEAPRAIKLVFDEEVVPRLARVTVVGTQRQQLARSPNVAGAVVSVPLRPGQSGSYTVRWRMVATDDALILFSDPTEAMQYLMS